MTKKSWFLLCWPLRDVTSLNTKDCKEHVGWVAILWESCFAKIQDQTIKGFIDYDQHLNLSMETLYQKRHLGVIGSGHSEHWWVTRALTKASNVSARNMPRAFWKPGRYINLQKQTIVTGFSSQWRGSDLNRR